MKVFLLPDARAPLTLQRWGRGWTICDAQYVSVLRRQDGRDFVDSAEEAEALLPGTSTTSKGTDQ